MDTAPAAAAAAPDYRALLVTLLKLTPAGDGDEVTDEQIMAALDTPEPDPEPVALAATVDFKSEISNLKSLEALSARTDALERRLLIQGATAAGKAIPLPDATLAELTLTALTALLDALPAGAVPTATGARAPELPAVRPVALSADQLTAAKALGLTDSEYLAAL
jgi:phage I-like protein